MNEELLQIVEAMIAAGEPAESIEAVINQYQSPQEEIDIPDANIMPVSQRDLDDGLKPESYVNSTAWSSSGLDRSTYYDEQGNLLTVNAIGIPFDPLTDTGYSLALEDEARREELMRESEAPEITTTEGLFTVTDEDQENAISAANATYDSYAAIDQVYESDTSYQSFNYMDGSSEVQRTRDVLDPQGDGTQTISVTETVAEGWQTMYYEGFDAFIPGGETPREREARFMGIWRSQGKAMENGTLNKPRAFSSSASELTFTAEKYAQWRLGLARDPSNDLYDPLLASNIYDKFE